MKRRIFVCILALCMILTAMPVAVYAEEPVGENDWNSDCPVPHQYVMGCVRMRNARSAMGATPPSSAWFIRKLLVSNPRSTPTFVTAAAR